MLLFSWSTEVGEILAYAESVEDAREAVMESLQDDDPRKADVQRVIKPTPQIIPSSHALVAWTQ